METNNNQSNEQMKKLGRIEGVIYMAAAPDVRGQVPGIPSDSGTGQAPAAQSQMSGDSPLAAAPGVRDLSPGSRAQSEPQLYIGYSNRHSKHRLNYISVRVILYTIIYFNVSLPL